jgi:glutamyl-tRNA synthetase
VDQVRVRFAPSPTGDLHVGNARTALFCWLFARSREGHFILRIEDTDPDRTREGGESTILDGLAWLGFEWDEGPDRGGPFGPYRQSERLPLYHQYGRQILHSGRGYPCFCDPVELAGRRAEAQEEGRTPRYDRRCRDRSEEERRQLRAAGRPHALRLKAPADGEIVVEDGIRGTVRFRHDELDDFILVRSDGRPTYNFACAVDDHLMRITHVIRGEEHLSNTPRQLLIYEALGLPIPRFAHLPMILAPDRSKLSKRHGATSLQEYRDQGYTPEALVNYLTLLGWSHPDGIEIFSPAEAMAHFSLDRVSASSAVYDDRKLTWLNGHYLRALPLEEVTRRARPFLRAAGYDAEEGRLLALMAAVRDRIARLSEAPDALAYFFESDFAYDEQGLAKQRERDGLPDLLDACRATLDRIPGADFSVAAVEAAYRNLADERRIRAAEIIHPTRLAVSGRTAGPGLFDIMALLGKEETLARLDRFARYLRSVGEA